MLVTSTTPLKPACLALLALSTLRAMDALYLSPGVGITISNSKEEHTVRKRKCCGDCIHNALYLRKLSNGTIRWIAICERFRKVVLPQLPACDFYLKDLHQEEKGVKK